MLAILLLGQVVGIAQDVKLCVFTGDTLGFCAFDPLLLMMKGYATKSLIQLICGTTLTV